MSTPSRNSKATPLADAIEQFLEAYKLKQKFKESYVPAYWEELMGPSIAKRTEKVFVKDSTLFLKISSSPLRKELLLAKTKLMELINKEAGEQVIKDVVFI